MMSDKPNLEHELRSLRAELATVRSQQAKAEAIRAAVATRGAADPVALEKAISGMTRANANGDLAAVDEAGQFRFGNGPGAYMPVNELLDDLKVSSPALFQGSAPAKPFKPSASITETMVRLRDAPEEVKAEYLQYLSSLGRP